MKTWDEPRSMDQLRADVLAELIVGKSDHGSGVAAQVFVHVPIGTALGITEDGYELVGYGPIPGGIARQIMTDHSSVWRKVVTDPVSGTVRDVGRRQYRPPKALDDLVRVRDRECRMPGCHRPAYAGDLDHHRSWVAGGHTSETNLNGFCRYHHKLKDQPGWCYDIDPDTREFTVTTPTRRTYRSPLERNQPCSPRDVEKSDIENTNHPVSVPTPGAATTYPLRVETRPEEPAPF